MLPESGVLTVHGYTDALLATFGKQVMITLIQDGPSFVLIVERPPIPRAENSFMSRSCKRPRAIGLTGSLLSPSFSLYASCLVSTERCLTEVTNKAPYGHIG